MVPSMWVRRSHSFGVCSLKVGTAPFIGTPAPPTNCIQSNQPHPPPPKYYICKVLHTYTRSYVRKVKKAACLPAWLPNRTRCLAAAGMAVHLQEVGSSGYLGGAAWRHCLHIEDRRLQGAEHARESAGGNVMMPYRGELRDCQEGKERSLRLQGAEHAR